MGEAKNRDRIAAEEDRQIDQRVGFAIAQCSAAGMPAVQLRQLDMVTRPYLKLLAEWRRNGAAVEDVYLGWVHLNQNILAELMLATVDDPDDRTVQALHMCSVLLKSIPGVMEWAKDKTFMAAPARTN
jgi:hypothetical protein